MSKSDDENKEYRRPANPKNGCGYKTTAVAMEINVEKVGTKGDQITEIWNPNTVESPEPEELTAGVRIVAKNNDYNVEKNR